MRDLPANPFLQQLKMLHMSLSAVGQVWLVGGALRDTLLGHQPVDFDFTVEHDPTNLARSFARECGGHWFWLDEGRRQSRVVIGASSFDFATWRAPTLTDDLARRDFTINAMALDMAGPLDLAHLVDPLEGGRHLAQRILRCAGPEVLMDDPLRLLKGIRHAVELRLSVAPETLLAMRACAGRLPDMAPERVRLEIWKILAAPEAGRGIALLADTGAGAVLFRQDFCSRHERVRAVLERSVALLGALAGASPAVDGWLREPVEQGLERATLLLWCHALGAIDAEVPLDLARRWRFSRAAQTRIAALRRTASPLWEELPGLPCRPRQVALWALQYGPDPVDLLLSIGLSRDVAVEDVCCRLRPYLEAVAELGNPAQVPPLVAGEWLMRELAVTGAALGAALDTLRRAEIAGVVSNCEEARQFLRKDRRKNS